MYVSAACWTRVHQSRFPWNGTFLLPLSLQTIRKCFAGKDLMVLWCTFGSCTQWELHQFNGFTISPEFSSCFSTMFSLIHDLMKENSPMRKKSFRKLHTYNSILFAYLSTDGYKSFQAFLWEKSHFLICMKKRKKMYEKNTHRENIQADFLFQTTNQAAWGFSNVVRCFCFSQLPRPICTSFCHTAILKVHVLKFRQDCLQNSSKTVPLRQYWFAEHLLLSIVNTETFVSSESNGFSLCYNHAPTNQRKYVKTIQPLLIFYLGTLSFSDHIFISINFGLIFNSLFSVMVSTQ